MKKNRTKNTVQQIWKKIEPLDIPVYANKASNVHCYEWNKQRGSRSRR